MAQTSISILDDIQSTLSGDTVGQISRKIGADPAQTKAAIDQAIPMLVAALGKEAGRPRATRWSAGGDRGRPRRLGGGQPAGLSRR